MKPGFKYIRAASRDLGDKLSKEKTARVSRIAKLVGEDVKRILQSEESDPAKAKPVQNRKKQ